MYSNSYIKKKAEESVPKPNETAWVQNETMAYKRIVWSEPMAEVNLAIFGSGQSGTEFHATIELTDTAADTETQFKAVETAIERLQIETELLHHASPVFKRYFVSDAINQAHLLPENKDIAVSVVQQPPLNGTKVSVWMYWVKSSRVSTVKPGTVCMERPSFRHLYTTQMHSRQKNEVVETYFIFDNYTEMLTARHCTLKDNCIRTWIYVQGVDIHYEKMVTARKTYFDREDLTDRTHYIASTGIEGKYKYPDSIILMDAYSIEGIKKEQITYLQGLSHLNPTIEYGVTFERATAVDYADRRHIYVSGTASIDNKGQIVHPLCIEKQIERTFENIHVLLAEAQAAMTDIAQMIVYLRDTADYQLVNEYISIHYPQTPKVIVWAPVCRPGWLIEIECIAIKAIKNNRFEPF